MPSRRRSGSSSSAGRSSSSATATGSTLRSRECAWASCRGGRHVRDRRRRTSSGSRARRSVSSLPRARRRSSSAIVTPRCCPRSPSSRRRSIDSRSRSGISRAPRCVRWRSRSRAGQKGSSAMPHKRNPIVSERICGLARLVRGYALVGLENVALWHERDISHSSAERVALPDAFLAVDYMLDRFAWLVEGLVVRPERMRANLEATGGLFFSQRLLLALVESGLDRDAAYRLVQRHAMRAWDEGLDFRSLVRGDPEIAARVDVGEVFDLGAYTRHVDVVFERRRAPLPEGGAGVSESATHIASGKVREIYALDDETLVLAASDRISTFDVVLPTPIPDKGRVLTGLVGVLVRAHARDRAESPARARRRRSLDDLPPARDASGRVRRARLSRRLGLEGLPRDRSRLRARAPGGLEESARLPEPIVTPATKAAEGHDENIDERARAALCGETRYAQAGAAALALYRFGRSTPRRAGSSSRTRSSSSASRATGGRARRRGDDARLVALLARGRSTRPGALSRPSTSSSSATGASDGWNKDARARAARGCRRGDARALRRGVRATDRDRLRRLRRRSGGRAVKATVLVRPKDGHPRPAGRGGRALAAQARLRRRGRLASAGSIDLDVEADDAGRRAAQIERMCDELLANPLIESFEIRSSET